MTLEEAYDKLLKLYPNGFCSVGSQIDNYFRGTTKQKCWIYVECKLSFSGETFEECFNKIGDAS